jgi:chromosome segregation ATPase
MPLGLWKSKVEIYREENDRRHAEWREEMDRRHAEWREEMEYLRVETRDLRADYDREIAETRLFNRELLNRLEKTYGNLNATMELVGVELGELKAAVRSQTDAIMKLVDRFEDSNGRPPA